MSSPRLAVATLRAARNSCTELSADKWGLVAEHFCGADSGSWWGVAGGVFQAAPLEDVDRASTAGVEGGGEGDRTGDDR